MTAQRYTELVGEDQYVRMMVVLGYGPLSIGGEWVGAGYSLVTEATGLTGDPIKIGGTPIDDFEDVEFEIGDPDDVTLYTDTVVETAVSTAIDGASDPTSDNDTVTDNVSLTRTTDFDTDEVSLEVYFPALFTVSDNGNTRWCRVYFTVEYSVAGASSWVEAGTFSVASIERKPIRKGFRFNLPSSGQWDIRLTRDETFYARESSFFSDCTWTVLRSIKRDRQPFDVDNTVIMALRIRATDQINGYIDRLSVSATSVLQVWNGATWELAETASPAWAYVDVFTGHATRNPADLSRVETAALLSWATWCADEGIEFNAVIDAHGTVMDRAQEIAAAGLGAWNVTDQARISIVRDEVLPSQMLVTPRNSYNFRSEHTFHKIPHALRVQFMDPDRWEATERVVYDDGYDENNATRVEQLPLFGCTDPDQAWKAGRYHLAQLRLRPETFTFSQDVQHLLLRRGSSFDLAQDTILVGLKYARVTSVTLDGNDEVSEFDVDEIIYMEAQSNGYYGFKAQRVNDGSIHTGPVLTVSPSTQTLTPLFPIPEIETGTPGLAEGDLITFGVAGSETLKGKVVRIEPEGELKASITAVAAAENIFDGWTGDIPAFDPVITEPIDVSLLPPTTPTIVEISSESPPSPTRAAALRLVIAYEMPPGLVGVVVEAWVRQTETISSVDYEGEWKLLGAAESDAGVIYVDQVEEGITYEVKLRARRGQRLSGYSATGSHTIGSSGWEIVVEQVAQNAITARASDYEQAAQDIASATYQDVQSVTVDIGDTTTGVRAYCSYSGYLFIETDGSLAFGPTISGNIRIRHPSSVTVAFLTFDFTPDGNDEIRHQVNIQGEIEPGDWSGTGSQGVSVDAVIAALDTGDIVTAELSYNQLEIIVTKDNA